MHKPIKMCKKLSFLLQRDGSSMLQTKCGQMLIAMAIELIKQTLPESQWQRNVARQCQDIVTVTKYPD